MRYFYSELSTGNGPLAREKQVRLQELLSDAIAALKAMRDFDENNGREVNHTEYKETIEDAVRDIACALGYQCTLYKVPF